MRSLGHTKDTKGTAKSPEIDGRKKRCHGERCQCIFSSGELMEATCSHFKIKRAHQPTHIWSHGQSKHTPQLVGSTVVVRRREIDIALNKGREQLEKEEKKTKKKSVSADVFPEEKDRDKRNIKT